MKIFLKLFCITWQFSLIFLPLQVIFIHYELGIVTAIVVNEDDNVNSGLKGLNH